MSSFVKALRFGFGGGYHLGGLVERGVFHAGEGGYFVASPTTLRQLGGGCAPFSRRPQCRREPPKRFHLAAGRPFARRRLGT